ncbi:unnamed protein product [Rhodiola kirilowii]
MAKIKAAWVLLLVLCVGVVAVVATDPERELTECRQQCQIQKKDDKKEMMKCERICSERFGRGNPSRSRYEEGRQEEEEEEQHSFQQSSPYVFKEHHFVEKFRAEHGRVSILQKFTDESELLKGLENFRLGFLVAEPQTFIVPHHLDADAVFFVVKGTGTITQIREKDNKRESFHIRAGDVIKLEAGTPLYMINQDENQQLFIAKLLTPVANPGEFEAFYGGGGGNPESFYSAFSIELLEAALQTPREQLQKLFGQQRQGVIIKASKEKIQSLSKEHEESGVWPFRGTTESKGRRPLNLFEQKPTSSNEFGQLFEACPEEFRQLRDINVAVSFTNITQGAMMGPFYNSKATKIVFVTNGEGYFENGFAHISQKLINSSTTKTRSRGRRQQQEQQATRYQKVTSRLQRNTVFIVPAGHPVAHSRVKQPKPPSSLLRSERLQQPALRPSGKEQHHQQNAERSLRSSCSQWAARTSTRSLKSENMDELFFSGPGQQRKSTWSII